MPSLKAGCAACSRQARASSQTSTEPARTAIAQRTLLRLFIQGNGLVMIIRVGVHGIVHACWALVLCQPWNYESRWAEFLQGLLRCPTAPPGPPSGLLLGVRRFSPGPDSGKAESHCDPERNLHKSVNGHQPNRFSSRNEHDDRERDARKFIGNLVEA